VYHLPTGDLPGAEVEQLYVASPKDSGYRPVRELKCFEKVYLRPGENKEVTFELCDRSFAVWQNGWVVPAGTYHIQIADFSVETEIYGETVTLHRNDWYDKPENHPTQPIWEAMLGRHYVEEQQKKGFYTMDNSVMEMKDHSLIMKIMFSAVESTVAKGFGGKKDYSNPEFKMMILSSAGSPLRSMQISGGMKGGLMRGLLEMANGHYLRGIRKMITG